MSENERMYRTPWARALGERLEAWDWSQTAMATYVGEAPQRINDWVKGRSVPSDAVKPKLVKLLNIRASEVAPEWLRDLAGISEVPPAPTLTEGSAAVGERPA